MAGLLLQREAEAFGAELASTEGRESLPSGVATADMIATCDGGSRVGKER